jgi:hypothetical protein
MHSRRMRSLLSTIVALIVIFTTPITARGSGRSHHIHSSCESRPKWSQNVDLSLHATKLTVEMLSGSTIPKDIADAAYDYFKVYPDNPRFANIKGIDGLYITSQC